VVEFFFDFIFVLYKKQLHAENAKAFQSQEMTLFREGGQFS
jgi:hypothetical protein